MIYKQPYCRLERFGCFEHDNPWQSDDEIVTEEYEDFQSVVQRIVELAKQWENRVPQLIQQKLLSEDDKNVCITVIIRNCWDDWIQVGVSNYGWMLSQYPPEDAFIFIEEIEETVVFLIPEWTGVRLRQLRTESSAKRILKEWLDTNQATP